MFTDRAQRQLLSLYSLVRAALWLHSSTVSPVRASPAGWGPDSPHAPETRCSWPTPGASAAWPSRGRGVGGGHTHTHTSQISCLFFFLSTSSSWQRTALLTRGSDSKVLGGGGVSLGAFFSSVSGPMLGGGRWKRRDWSCCALGQGRVPLTHSTGSSQTAFCP